MIRHCRTEKDSERSEGLSLKGGHEGYRLQGAGWALRRGRSIATSAKGEVKLVAVFGGAVLNLLQ